MADRYFCVTMTLCSPTIAKSIRAGSLKRESKPRFGYFERTYRSTKKSSATRGTLTSSMNTSSTCTTPWPPLPLARATTRTSCRPVNNASSGLTDCLPAVISSKSTSASVVITFVIGYAAVAWLLRFLTSHAMYWFVGYRVLLALTVMALLAAGVLA